MRPSASAATHTYQGVVCQQAGPLISLPAQATEIKHDLKSGIASDKKHNKAPAPEVAATLPPSPPRLKPPCIHH